MVSIERTLRHLFTTGWTLRRAFDAATLQAIEQAIAATERGHGGEIRFAVEAHRGAIDLMRGVTPRDQALHAFARLGVWDTDANNGVLIYVSWADRDVEIVADRGFNGRVSEQEWAQVCRHMEQAFARGAARQAAVEGIHAVGALIARHFPAADRDELPNRPVLL
ncbi:MAG TPA: TPM domain-containing protein [Steroidobacteraceae bacterium]|nr:TPM domain-containing protein [Steroidobacteraceae bacterium]